MVLRTITHQTDHYTILRYLLGVEKKQERTPLEKRSDPSREEKYVPWPALCSGTGRKSEQRAEGLDLRLPGKQGAESPGSLDPGCPCAQAETKTRCGTSHRQ
ncbi:hypothetical protein ATANTOWER_008208 [Ataeniobius toweri]|uniref:Uncharacterized protein n=1 Tax=Ataeniobius toweri TaxID=208326 RepID=A0ABU7AU85_9TELE|nr:hypothetical protein [Ataeniobius toweri]